MVYTNSPICSPAKVSNQTDVVWRINLVDGAGKSLEARSSSYEQGRTFRGRLSTLDVHALTASALPSPNVEMVPSASSQWMLPASASEGAKMLQPGNAQELAPIATEVGSVLGPERAPARAEFVRRLRRMPLTRLADAVVEMQDLPHVDDAVWKALLPRPAQG